MKPRIGKPLVDVSQSVPFEFDGKKLTGHPGDTLASALIANNVKVMGRSFKYHRPRGLLADGLEEPNALVTIDEGAETTPNLRATEVEIFAGLKARSQNHLGSLNFDLLRVNDLLSPFLGAGFYYKSFMSPKGLWEKLYEPIIRRAAGLGTLSKEPSSRKKDRGFLFCDLLVIGSGLAGLEAALIAGEAGADVILVESDFEFGGRLIKEKGRIDGRSYRDWRDQALERLRQMPNIRLMNRATAIGVYDGRIFAVHERIERKRSQQVDAPSEFFWRIRARSAILAAGATERPIAFEKNDIPGVMLSSAVQALLHRFGLRAGEKIAVYTNNSQGWALARDLEALGCPPVAVIDPRSIEGEFDFPVFKGDVLRAKGGSKLQSIIVQPEGATQRIDCDVLAISGGFNPNLQLTAHHGAWPKFDETILSFVSLDEQIPGLHAVGACRGYFVDKDSVDDLHQRLPKLLEALGFRASLVSHKLEDAPYEISPKWVVGKKGKAPKRGFVDFQNDVTVKDIEQAHRENFRSPEHLKRYTTLGMAPDQGKTSNINALAISAELQDTTIDEVGTTNYRPFVHPIPIDTLGAGAKGKGFAPERYTPTHEFAREKGAQFVEEGLWYRASYFPYAEDKNWRQACDREVGFVRNAVGICDISTLGKIHLSGKDASKFLDLVYANTLSKLQIGGVRYGLMLREDGMVLDDGVCARLSETEYFMTTTTAAADEVVKHFEFCAQCLMRGSDIRLTSVTDQFAQIAVAGPKSRALLESLVKEKIDDEALPFMSWVPITIGGVSARLMRISFSGGMGFEISLPRRFGENLVRELVKRAEVMGGGLYGVEALDVLRMEKGFITHAEIDGRVTAQDLGLSKLVSAQKDCIGKVMAARPELLDENRSQLVGIRPVGAVQKLLAGAVMVEVGDEPVRENLKGYVSSVCFSPTLGHMIGLAFVNGGQKRIGEKIRAVDLVRDFDTLCEIVDPEFYKSDGVCDG